MCGHGVIEPVRARVLNRRDPSRGATPAQAAAQDVVVDASCSHGSDVLSRVGETGISLETPKHSGGTGVPARIPARV